jgi:hypothetical protein
MLCVALLIILLAWSALCVATMIQCVVYEFNPLYHNYCTESDCEVEFDVSSLSRHEETDVVTVELLLRWCCVVFSMVLLLSAATTYDC